MILVSKLLLTLHDLLHSELPTKCEVQSIYKLETLGDLGGVYMPPD